MRKAVNFLIVTWGLVCLAIVFCGLAATLAPGELKWAWPVPNGLHQTNQLTRYTALALTVLAALSLNVAVNLVQAGQRRRPWAELVLFYALVFGFVWWIVGPGQLGPLHWLVGMLLLGAAVGLKISLRQPRPIPPPWHTWLAADALLILSPILAGVLLGNHPDGPAIWTSMLFYPLYAMVQLLVFLVIPADRLQAMGVSRRVSAATCAGLLALIHWPNPLVMLLTLVAMLWWATQYRQGRRLWQLALVMGLAATTASQFLPDDLTRHMRVGHSYIRQATIQDLAGDPTHRGQVPLDEFLARVYPQTMGRAPTPAETRHWAATLDQALRPVVAWHFFISEEYSRLAQRKGLPASPAAGPPWTKLTAAWQQRINSLTAAGADLPWSAYIVFLYEKVLLRMPTPGESEGWTRDPNWSQRQRIIDVLLTWRRENGSQDPVHITTVDLNLYQ